MLSLATLASVVYVSNLLVSYFNLRFSAAILSIGLMLAFFLLNKGVPSYIKATSDFLLKHMGLFLIPPVIMVLAYQAFFFEHGLALLLVIVVSTVLSFVVVLLFTRKLIESLVIDENSGSNDD